MKSSIQIAVGRHAHIELQSVALFCSQLLEPHLRLPDQPYFVINHSAVLAPSSVGQVDSGPPAANRTRYSGGAAGAGGNVLLELAAPDTYTALGGVGGLGQSNPVCFIM